MDTADVQKKERLTPNKREGTSREEEDGFLENSDELYT